MTNCLLQTNKNHDWMSLPVRISFTMASPFYITSYFSIRADNPSVMCIKFWLVFY